VSTRDDGLQGLLDDTHEGVRRVAASVPPDFSAVLARAHELAPERIPADVGVADSAVIDIRSNDRGSVQHEAALDGLFADVRAAVLRRVADRRMHSIPALPVPVRRRTASRWIAVASLAAAALALAIGGYRWVEHAREDQAAPADQAFLIETPEQDTGDVVEVLPAPLPVVPRPGPTTGLAPAPLERVVATPTAESPRNVVRRAAGLDADHLRALADEAHALWRKGDLRGAESRFLTITRKGGRSVQAELAWADLFALARQMGDDSRRLSRWKAYLGAFPRGRFADDARAGLCRAKPDAACWRAYLRDVPKGSYRAEAEAALVKLGAP